tara:strand:+ start:640 stop:1080 length:441 start_codon:yes stop_codon:yes gene_type:complete
MELKQTGMYAIINGDLKEHRIKYTKLEKYKVPNCDAHVDLLYNGNIIFMCCLNNNDVAGHGRILLNNLIKYADLNNKILKLCAVSSEAMYQDWAEPYQGEPDWTTQDTEDRNNYLYNLNKNNQWLIKYYEGFGFIKEGHIMVRTPQ